jgi:hypothetical protein
MRRYPLRALLGNIKRLEPSRGRVMPRLTPATTWMMFLAMWGCGSKGSPTGLSVPDMRGTWTYQNNVSDAIYVCAILGQPLMISQQSDTNFSGIYVGGMRICRSSGGTDTLTGLSGQVLNGVLSNANVQFDMDTSAYHNTGTLQGDSMGGLINWGMLLNGAPHVLSGTWTAVRH